MAAPTHDEATQDHVDEGAEQRAEDRLRDDSGEPAVAGGHAREPELAGQRSPDDPRDVSGLSRAMTALTRHDMWYVARRTVLLIAALIVGAWLVLELRAVVMLVLVSLILATGLRPLVEWLKDRRVPGALAVLLIYLGFVLACVGLGFLIVPPLLTALGTVVESAPGTADRIGAELQVLAQQHPFLAPLLGPLTQQAPNIGMQIGALAGEALGLATLALNLLSGLLTLILLLLLTFYLVTDGVRIRDYLLSFVAPRHRPRLRRVTDRMGERMGGYLLGEVVLSLVVGVASYIGLRLLGVPAPLILAVVAAIGVAIPIVGPFLAAIPPVLVALTQSPTLALVTLIFFIVLIQVEMNLLAPIVLHRAVHIHPVAVLIALLVGGALMGGMGAIVAVPLAAAISVVLDEFRYPDRAQAPTLGASPSTTNRAEPTYTPADSGVEEADGRSALRREPGREPEGEAAPEPSEPAPV